MNLSKYLSAAREIPAVRTKVMPIDSVDNGGCSAEVAISHAEAAISKISLNAADKFAIIAGKNLFEVMKSPSEPKISRAEEKSCRNRFLKAFLMFKVPIPKYENLCIQDL